jgi:hypothetical protein
MGVPDILPVNVQAIRVGTLGWPNLIIRQPCRHHIGVKKRTAPKQVPDGQKYSRSCLTRLSLSFEYGGNVAQRPINPVAKAQITRPVLFGHRPCCFLSLAPTGASNAYMR